MTKFYNKLSKIFFFILFFILIINSSYSQTTNPWSFYEYNKNIKWNCVSGDCLNGKGVGTYSDTNGRSIKYEGSWKNGLRHGDGRLERNHNSFTGIVGHTQMAQGFFENDLFQKGKIIYSAGITFEYSKGKAENILIEGASAKKFGVSKIELKYETIDLNGSVAVYNQTSSNLLGIKSKEMKIYDSNNKIQGFVLKNCDYKIYDSNNKILSSGKFEKINSGGSTIIISFFPYINSENSISFFHYFYAEYEEESFKRTNLTNTPLRGMYIHDVTNFNDYKYSYRQFDPEINALSIATTTIDLKKKTITTLFPTKNYQINKCE